MAASFVIGVDAGTEGLRAAIFDLQGAPVAFAATPYPTRFPQPSWAEQDPADWWQALGTSVRQALANAKLAAGDIAAIALDTTCCSVVALDAAGHPLRPALIWMDVRAGREAARVAATGDPALAVNSDGHGPVSAEWMIPKALWLQAHEPDLFAAAAHICEFQDYLNFHLTGRMVASLNNASVRWHYDNRGSGYAASLLGRLGAEALLDKWPREVVPMAALFGELTPAAAAHLGLRPGLPVAQGGADAFVGVIGLGIVDPGALSLITGSSHLQIGLSDRPFHGKGIFGTYPDAVLPGLHAVEGGQTSTGSVVAWFRRLLGSEASYDELNRAAAALPPGAEGLIALDHFQGNRTPYTDPDSRGVISGLTLKHGPAHIYRALIEGVSFGTALILETMRAAGFSPPEMTICGGATRSDLWLQIHADVANLPLALTRVADAPCLGSAILAAVGAGFYPDIPTAARAMVQVVRRIEPDAKRHAAYQPFYEAYKETYAALAGTLHRQVAASG